MNHHTMNDTDSKFLVLDWRDWWYLRPSAHIIKYNLYDFFTKTVLHISAAFNKYKPTRATWVFQLHKLYLLVVEIWKSH